MRGLGLLALAALLCAGCSKETKRATRRVAPGPPIAFVAGDDGYVYSATPDGGVHQLTRGRDWGAERLAWSPDHTEIAVVSDQVPNGERYSASVVLMDASGRHGRKLAFLTRSESQLRWRTAATIQVLDFEWPATTIVSEVSASTGGLREVGREPHGSLSPDGRRRLIVRGDWPRQDVQIYNARADGSHALNISRSRSIGPSRLREEMPVWSPDGGRVAYVAERGRGTQLWVMDADGSRERPLAPAPLLRTEPAWSPDGNQLAYEADVDDDGLDELYLVSANGGRPRKLAELTYIHDLDWAAAGRQAPTGPSHDPESGPPKPVRTYSYELKEGKRRLVDVRLLRRFRSDRERPTLTDVSPNGALVALFDQDGLAVLDLRNLRLRRLGRPRTPGSEPLARFSPDGRRLLYRSWDRLLARDLSTGASTLVARTTATSFTWLGDGRVAFLDRRGRVQVVRPGGRPHALSGLVSVDRFAITSDGRRALYDRGCETFLVDRRTGRSRRLSGHLFVPERAWAPDASFFMLQWAEECDPRTGAIWAYHSYDVLFSAAGTRVAELDGRGATWIRDSRLVFVYPQQTGTEVAGLEGLVAVDPLRRLQSTLLKEGNAYSEAFVGPGHWVVFSRYDRPDKVSDGYGAGALYVARLTGR